MVALDNQRVLLIEQGSDKDKTMINKIYLVDLAQASDLSAFDDQGKRWSSTMRKSSPNVA